MLTQATALALVATAGTFAVWAGAAVLLGAGTAMVYPTLLAVIGDDAHPTWWARDPFVIGHSAPGRTDGRRRIGLTRHRLSAHSNS